MVFYYNLTNVVAMTLTVLRSNIYDFLIRDYDPTASFTSKHFQIFLVLHTNMSQNHNLSTLYHIVQKLQMFLKTLALKTSMWYNKIVMTKIIKKQRKGT